VRTPAIHAGVLCLIGACSSGPPSPDAHLPLPTVEYTPPARVDPAALGLPTLPNGNTVLLAIPGLRLEHAPTLKDPLTALGACARWVTGCFEPGSRSLDACVNSVPSCTTDEPWLEATECCPAACQDAYRARRAANEEPWPALDATLFVDGSCMPGLAALVGAP
jgi:hypothetical protein